MRRRQGFTLVELLVSMALIIFIMAILSAAFSAAMTTFRNLKAAGDMAEKLRATVQLLQRDLAADHFEGKKRLSDLNFWQNGPPQQGFFQIYQGGTNNSPNPDGNLEGKDSDFLDSFRTIPDPANTAYGAQALAFTIKLRGNQMGDFLTAGSLGGGALLSGITSFGPPEARYQTTSGGSSYNYQWAEVAWFLVLQSNTTAADPVALSQSSNSVGSPVPLYTLYRRQRLAVPDNSVVTSVPYTNGNCLELSCWNNNGTLYFNSPTDLTVPQRRSCGIGNPLAPKDPTSKIVMLPGAFTTIAQDLSALTALGVTNLPPLGGSDIQLNDVVSFDVRVLTADSNTATFNDGANNGVYIDPFVTLGTIYSQQNTYFNPGQMYEYVVPSYAPPSSWVPASAYLFDTWSSLNDNLVSNPSQSYLQWDNNTLSPAPPNVIPFWTLKGSQVSVPTGAPTAPIILAIQISIRIWDYKTNQTRQVTIIQAM